jgi:hypothetical protein
MEKSEKTEVEYEKPEVVEYGDLRELTASRTTSGLTDVPSGTPGGPGDNLFS